MFFSIILTGLGCFFSADFLAEGFQRVMVTDPGSGGGSATADATVCWVCCELSENNSWEALIRAEVSFLCWLQQKLLW